MNGFYSSRNWRFGKIEDFRNWEFKNSTKQVEED